MTLRTHVACRRPSEAFPGQPLALRSRNSRFSKEDQGESGERLCAQESADEIYLRWCCRPALGEKRGERKEERRMARHLIGSACDESGHVTQHISKLV